MTTRADVIAWLEDCLRQYEADAKQAAADVLAGVNDVFTDYQYGIACARAALDCVRAVAALEDGIVLYTDTDMRKDDDDRVVEVATGKFSARRIGEDFRTEWHHESTPVAAIMAAAQTPERDK